MSESEPGDRCDERLVELFRNSGGDEHFNALFERHHAAVFRRCFSVVHNRAEADELTQQTFMTAFNKLHLFRGGSFQSWLLTIARNVCLNQVRPAPGQQRAEHIDRRSAAPGDVQLAGQVAAALTQLTEAQRLVLKLFYMDGYSYKEIALMTSCSIRQVKTYLQNGRRRFRLVWQDVRAKSATG